MALVVVAAVAAVIDVVAPVAVVAVAAVAAAVVAVAAVAVAAVAAAAVAVVVIAEVDLRVRGSRTDGVRAPVGRQAAGIGAGPSPLENTSTAKNGISSVRPG